MFRTQPIALRNVAPHPSGNCRQSYDEKELDKLEQSIRSVGLLHPPGVQPNGRGSFWLVFGWRRDRVLRRIHGLDTPIPLLVCDGDIDAEILALVENVQRVDLEPWELADKLADLVTLREMSPAQVAELVKISPSHVRNMVRLRQQLCPELWATFRRLGHGANLSHFLKLAALPKGHQVAAWNADLERGETSDRPRGSATVHARRLLDSIPSPKRGEPSAYWRGARAALRAVLERQTWEALKHGSSETRG